MIVATGPIVSCVNMEYVRLSKSHGFKYACNSHLYSHYTKKRGIIYLKCDIAGCKGTAKNRARLVIYDERP